MDVNCNGTTVHEGDENDAINGDKNADINGHKNDAINNNWKKVGKNGKNNAIKKYDKNDKTNKSTSDQIVDKNGFIFINAPIGVKSNGTLDKSSVDKNAKIDKADKSLKIDIPVLPPPSLNDKATTDKENGILVETDKKTNDNTLNTDKNIDNSSTDEDKNEKHGDNGNDSDNADWKF
uniref:Uncharacterized protein n=1 Tax=Panagrolaimus superbus TaxID=310955 RepID=A0A914XWN3_9BILA